VKIDSKWTVIVAVAMLGTACHAGVDGLLDLNGSVLEFRPPQNVSVGMEACVQRREVVSGGAVDKVSAWHFDAVAGCQPASWLTLAAGVGAAEARFADVDGELGLDWLVRSEIGLLEYAIDESPERGRKETVRFSLGVSYRDSESNAPEGNSDWREVQAVPQIAYAVDLRTPGDPAPLDTPAAAIRAGLIFSAMDGSMLGRGIDENRDFGLLLGFDVLLASNWALNCNAYGFDTHEVSVALGLMRRF
jgi:hypothetical protein